MIEKYAFEKKIYKIKSEVVFEAIDFYRKSGYEILEKKDEMYNIEKNLKKEIEKIIEIFDLNEKEVEYDTDSTTEYCEVDLEKEKRDDMETEIGDEDYIMKNTYEEEIFYDDKSYDLCTIS